jgi:hypothetical protein
MILIELFAVVVPLAIAIFPRPLQPSSLQLFVVDADLNRTSRFFPQPLALSNDSLAFPLRRAKPYGRCALVGNDATVTNSSCGQTIDEAELTVRFDFAPVATFEADVGFGLAQTTLIVLSTMVLVEWLTTAATLPPARAVWLQNPNAIVAISFDDLLERKDNDLLDAFRDVMHTSRCRFVSWTREFSQIVAAVLQSTEAREPTSRVCDLPGRGRASQHHQQFSGALSAFLLCDVVTVVGFEHESACPHWRHYFDYGLQPLALSHAKVVERAAIDAIRKGDPPHPLQLASFAQVQLINAQCGKRKTWVDAMLNCRGRSSDSAAAAAGDSEAARLFDSIDTDGNGFIESPSQLRAVDPFLRHDSARFFFDHADNVALRRHVFAFFDVGGIGLISKTDFCFALQERLRARERVSAQFRTFAQNGSMSRPTFCQFVLCDVGHSLHLDGAKIFRAADLDADASLDEDEFLLANLVIGTALAQKKIDAILGEPDPWLQRLTSTNDTCMQLLVGG